MRLDDPTSLSMLCHLNSEPWLNDEAYRSAPLQESRVPKHYLGYVPLPAAPHTSLMPLMKARLSTRAFRPELVPLATVTGLLTAAYGVVAIQREGGRSDVPVQRSIPSAGGLYPLEIFAFLRRIDGLEDGIYHYDPMGHGLRQMSGGDPFAGLEEVFYTHPFIREANGIVVFAAVFERMQKKYGPRGYRYVLLEAGHGAQNLCLSASELGVATLCMGGFIDSSLNAVLDLDASREGAVYTVAFGMAAKTL